ncbi:MAG TPA: protein kinase [Terriglobales bacterium]|nr:protein kinase [Terriglobales bacterium]
MPANGVSTLTMIGQALSRYVIREQIGAGAMGVVYLAHDGQLERDVALKVLPPGALADETARKRFRKEALALAKLNHPNVETVFDFGTENGVDFLVTEYIPGTTLDIKLAAGPLPEKQVLILGAQLAEGLDAAHSQNIVHRDLKPGNLRITPDNRLKILDFGLARLVQPVSKTAVTETGGERGPMGTIPYMAPEQLRGEGVDTRSDIWAVGAVLYESATGSRPFPETHMTRLIDSILHDQPALPSAVTRQISPVLENIILKCLEKDAENRYQSVRELLIDLRRLSTGMSTNVVPLRRKAGWRWMAVLAALVVLMLAITWIGWRQGWFPGARVQVESVAVLPLVNLSHDPEQDYLADGMTEALITDLGQIRGLRRVISRTSVMRYKKEPQPLQEIARQLNVDRIVEGSVQRSGDTVQVTARLLNASTDTQLWSQSYQRELRDLLTLQRELALTIANEIRVKLTPQEQERLTTAHPVNPAAHDAYLKANYLNTGTYEQRKKAREYYEQAIRLDPSYAPAYAGLADYYWGTPDRPAAEVMPKAKAYALKAIALDDSLADAHTALASVLFYGDWDWAGADREFRRALELNPSDAEAHRIYSVFLSAMTRFEDAAGQVMATQTLDPLSAHNNSTAGWVFYCARQYDRAAQQCRKALELAPNFDGAHACLGYAFLGQGSYSQAIDEFQKALDLSGGDAVRTIWLGRAYAQAGDRPNALKVLARLKDQSTRSYIPPYFFATLYTALGEKEEAFRWLEKAYSERDLYLAWIKFDPALDPLRSDTRFQRQLLHRMNL